MKSVKVKTLCAYKPRANHVISRGAGEVINMPEADYEEVKDLVIVLDKKKNKKNNKEKEQWQ